MKFSLLVTVLLAVVIAAPVAAEVPPPIPRPLVFDAGAAPIGKVFAHPSWGCANLTIEDFDNGQRTLTVKVNIEPNLLLDSRDAPPREMPVGQQRLIRTIGRGFISFYWQVVTKNGIRRVVIFVTKYRIPTGWQSFCGLE